MTTTKKGTIERRNNVTVVNDIKNANCITHPGIFHADEVFATVLLSKVLPEVRVCRTSNVNDAPEDAIVYDIGGGEFDHHFYGFAVTRNNGIKFSSFGLLWQKYGMEFLSYFVNTDENFDNAEEIFEQFDKTLVEGIDATDNGQTELKTNVKIQSISTSISAFNPNWDESVAINDRFIEAIDFATKIFDNTLKGVIAKVKAKTAVEKAIENSKNHIMVLERFVPWDEHLFNSANPKAEDIMYVVFASVRGGYSVQAVPATLDRFKQHKPLPEECGVKTADFCHFEHFMCSSEELDEAIMLAKKIAK